jgi:hypothetical protein
MPELVRRLARTDRSRSRGQSLVELALTLPVVLLLLLIAIDFGRVYLGWVNLQQMARIAANYAADHATAWDTPGDATVRARYQSIIRNDARLINCTLPPTLPDPQFPTGTAIGQEVKVQLSCQFSLRSSRASSRPCRVVARHPSSRRSRTSSRRRATAGRRCRSR